MHRIDTPTASPDLFGPGKSGFVGGDPLLGQASTAFSPEWCNDVQESLVRLIEAVGITPEKGNHGQLVEVFAWLVERMETERRSALRQLQLDNWVALEGLPAAAYVKCIEPVLGGWFIGTTDGLFATSGYVDVHSQSLVGRRIRSVAMDKSTGAYMVACEQKDSSPILYHSPDGRSLYNVDTSSWVDNEDAPIENVRAIYWHPLYQRWLVEVESRGEFWGWMTSVSPDVEWLYVPGTGNPVPPLVLHGDDWLGASRAFWLAWDEALLSFVQTGWAVPHAGYDRIVWWPEAQCWLGWTISEGEWDVSRIARSSTLDGSWQDIDLKVGGRNFLMAAAAPVDERLLGICYFEGNEEVGVGYLLTWREDHSEIEVNGIIGHPLPKDAEVLAPGPAGTWLVGGRRLVRPLILREV